jgi:hypothetical protein
MDGSSFDIPNSIAIYGITHCILSWSDEAAPKHDPIWAKMYCVFMFDRQIFSEYRPRRSNTGQCSR